MTTAALYARGKVMIEVGLNESVQRSTQVAVPVTVAQVIDDVVACTQAGAAVSHYHARDADGADIWSEVDFYRKAMTGLVERGCDAITYPTYLGSFEHIWQLDDTASGLRMAPFDVIQNVGLSIWDGENSAFRSVSLDALGADKSVNPPALQEIRRRGLLPVVAVFDVGQARWVRLAVRAGILAEPVNLKIFLHQSWILGPTPSPEALTCYLAELDGIDAEITVVPSTFGDRLQWEELIMASLRMGLNVRVGLGDCPAIHQGRTNAELVAEAVEMMTTFGVRPASPNDVASRFGLTGAANSSHP